MIMVAREKNQELDTELATTVDDFISSQQQKAGALKELFETPETSNNTEKTNEQTKKFNKLQQEAQQIIKATRTPLERYNKQMELLNKLLKEGHINQETFARATKDAQKELEKASEETTDSIEKKFEDLGKSIEDDLVEALDATSDKFLDFGDIGKKILSEINQTLIDFALKDLGITGEGGLIGSLFSGLGGLFGGGGSGSGGFGSLFSGISSFFGGFFADGGKLSPGKFGVVGENGPELAFAGSSPLNIMPNGMGAAPITVNMNVQTPDVQSFRQSQGQLAADMARSIDRARRNL